MKTEPELRAALTSTMKSALQNLEQSHDISEETRKQLARPLKTALQRLEAIPDLDELLEDSDNFDEMKEHHRDIYTSSVASWIEFVQKEDGPGFEKRIKELRDTVDGDNLSTKDVAFTAYVTMYALDFAGILLGLTGGIRSLSEHPEQAQETIKTLVRTMESKKKVAQCFLQSLGIKSPQDSVVQLQWLQKLSLKKAKESGIRIALADLSGDNVRFMDDENDDF